ncbi:hypothetical protein CEXT_55621 [Caerostris extrusa]|uniref:Uncharacterized protein n=1 Tax=Caerostris extrusa TaxID=172846 RepID=A0AAV4NAX3_CAEEX|nr:hypothetical protein CEXT_55621 [Caerostris extrusa]
MSDTIQIFLKELKERSRPSDLNQRESPMNKPRAAAALEIAGTFSCLFLLSSSPLYGEFQLFHDDDRVVYLSGKRVLELTENCGNGSSPLGMENV